MSEDISGCTDYEEDETKFEENENNLDVEFSPTKDNKKDISNKIIKLKNNEAFSCSFCKNKFQNKKIYLKHLKTHPEYKKFLCNYCAKSKYFLQMYKLNNLFICYEICSMYYAE